MPAREQLLHEGVVRGGRAAPRSMATPAATAAREMLTPLPPACDSHRLDALHGAALERSGQGDGAVDAGVGGQGDDHAITTSSRPLEAPRGRPR